ncbi:MAG: TIR domain-containing protein [Sphingomonas sp.]
MISDDRAKVFISYARVDRARVKPIADALAAAGYDVWWDAMIEGGSAFAKAIEAHLDTADAVIVVWSATSVDSDWVRDEAGRGRDRKRLVPVLLDGVDPPLGFKQYHAIDLSRWKGRADAPELASVLRGVATTADRTVAPIASTVSGAKGPSRRTLLIAGGGVATAAATAGLLVMHPWRRDGASNGVAVLPFANLSGDPGQAYFSDGLSEEIRSALTRNAQLKVAAPTSSNTFRDQARDVRQIAAQLGVSFILEGSVRKAGNVVRIAADLIDAATGFTTWSQSFDRKIDDIFAVQSEIASTVAGALAAKVAPGARAPGGTTNVAAYDAYLRGRALYNSDQGEESDRAALTKFDEATAIDPRYATAFAARSRSLAGIASLYAKAGDLHATYESAVAAADQAVDLAPDLAAAHAALGFATFAGLLDFKAAKIPYDRAYVLGTGDADILVLCAFYASKTGDAARALTAIQRAESLDPLNPRTYRAHGSILVGARRYADAIPPSEHALRMNSKLSTAHATIGTAQYMLGNVAAARASFDAERIAPFRLTGVAICAKRLADQAGATAALAKLVADSGDSSAYQQAQVYAQWGQPDAAVAALDRARAAGDAGITAILNDPLLDPLRKDARFIRLLTSFGLA